MRTVLAVAAVVVVLVSGAVAGLLTGTGDSSASPLRGVGASEPAAGDREELADEEREGRTGPPAFVLRKKEWLACVADASGERARSSCGAKPHPHDLRGRPGPGRPPWAGGPAHRDAPPPGWERSDRHGPAARGEGR